MESNPPDLMPEEISRYCWTAVAAEHTVQKYCNVLGTSMAGVIAYEDRVAAAYLAGAFVVLQVADLIFEPLGLPANAYRALIIIAGLGFPLAVIASWFFDVKRAESRPRLRTRAAGALALEPIDRDRAPVEQPVDHEVP